MNKWNELTMAERAKYIKIGVQNGITSMKHISDAYNVYADGGQYNAGALVDGIYEASSRDEFLGNPEHNYDFTQSEEWIRRHGYTRDSRGHLDDRVKKPSHPTHPSRGTFRSNNEFELSDRGIGNSNYTLFGLVDNNQDPQATMTYRGSTVLPEMTVTPDKTYIHNSYDNIDIYFKNGGKINRFDDGGSMTPITDDFRKSILPPSLDDYIREHYGYRRYKLQDSIMDSIPTKKNKSASVGSDDRSANNISSTKAEPDTVEVNVSKPGTYFPLDWRNRPNTTVDDEGNYHTELPDVYMIDNRPLTFGDRLYRGINAALNSNPITSYTRVRNMQKANMSNYYNLSPRQTASIMSTVGNFIKPFNPAMGYGLQGFDLVFDTYDAIYNPSVGNTLSVLGDLSGLDFLTGKVRPFNLPVFDFPTFTFTDGDGNRLLSIPGGTVGGQTVNPVPAVNALKAFGVADDLANSFGYDLFDLKKSEDPDTIRIHSTPQGGYGEYIHTPWDEFNERKKNEYKKGGNLFDKGGMKTHSILNTGVATEGLGVIADLIKKGVKSGIKKGIDYIVNSNNNKDVKAEENYNPIQRALRTSEVGSIVKKDDNHYYRVNSDLTATRVQKMDDGTFRWKDPNGRLMQTSTSKFKELDDNTQAFIVAKEIAMDQKIDRDLNKLNKNELIQTQMALADEGYYEQILRTKSKSQIKKLQKKLKLKVDGIIGPKTIKAFNDSQVDGLLGNNTKKALRTKYNNQSNSTFKVKKGLDGCAQFVTSAFEYKNGNVSKQLGVIGDAWTMPQNIVNKGGIMKYNLYESKAFDNVKDVRDLRRVTKEENKKNPVDYNKVSVGDIVGIFIPSSDMHDIALKNGTTKNTHIGYIVGLDKDGMPLVSHNIHSDYRVDRIDKITGSKTSEAFITTVTSPKKSQPLVPELEFKPKESRFDVKNKGKDFQEVLNGMEGAFDIFQKMFTNINVEDAMITAIAVQNNETNMGRRRLSDVSSTSYIAKKKKELRDYVRESKGLKDDTKSSNQMKMKLSSLTPNEQRMLGINSLEDLESPQKAGIGALYIMCKNMDYFTRLKEAYPELGLSDDDVESLTMLSYNQGMGSLKNIGFRRDTGTLAPNEISEIRKLAEDGATIKDITSTNYRHMGKLGEWIYNMIGKEAPTYISRAKKAKSKIIRK